MYFEMNRKRRKKSILVQKCYLLRCINCRNQHLHCKSTCFLGEAATVEIRIQKASFPRGAQPHTSPSPDGWGGFPRTAPMPHPFSPHPTFDYFLFLFFFPLHLFYGVRMPLLSHGAHPKVGCRMEVRWKQAARRCCYRAGHEVWLFFKEFPCSLHHSTLKTTHFTSVTGNDMNVAGGETLLFSLFQRTWCAIC